MIIADTTSVNTEKKYGVVRLQRMFTEKRINKPSIYRLSTPFIRKNSLFGFMKNLDIKHNRISICISNVE